MAVLQHDVFRRVKCQKVGNCDAPIGKRLNAARYLQGYGKVPVIDAVHRHARPAKRSGGGSLAFVAVYKTPKECVGLHDCQRYIKLNCRARGCCAILDSQKMVVASGGYAAQVVPAG